MIDRLDEVIREACEGCEYCRGNDPRSIPCSIKGPRGYGCSRPMGHEGDHAACGVVSESHPIEVWEQGEDEVRTTPQEIDNSDLEEGLLIFEPEVVLDQYLFLPPTDSVYDIRDEEEEEVE